MNLKLEVVNLEPEARVLRVAGEVDLESVGQMDDRAQEVLRSKPKTFLLDLSAVSYLGSAGIGELLSLNAEMAERGGRLVVVGAQAGVLAALQLVGFAEVALLAETLDDARRLLAGRAA